MILVKLSDWYEAKEVTREEELKRLSRASSHHVTQYHLFSLRYDIPMSYATVQLKPAQPHFDMYSATGF